MAMITPAPDNLVDFLFARVAEDDARLAGDREPPSNCPVCGVVGPTLWAHGYAPDGYGVWHGEQGDREPDHSMTWDKWTELVRSWPLTWVSQRWRDECDAKRLVLAEHAGDGDCSTCRQPQPCQTVRLMALPYTRHPYHRKEWLP